MTIYPIFKAVADRVFAAVLLVLTLPLSFTVALLLAFSLKGSPFFIQVRPGRHERHFKLIKFRTMTSDTDSNGQLLPDLNRLTKLGALVRKTSLDELPQLLNILKGDMSFIGPRPLLVEYLPLYSEEERRRHSVKPGITGLAQVNGRNAISWKQKFHYDLLYVDNMSLQMDIKIVLLTVKKVLGAEGVNASAKVTMSKYNGHN
ncbi:sugar transferase [Aliiglaciecola sp. CAU 1673]|uniref:sugar transferase n=1 Tax=Aliiglaciecola sp. CAU 1673 TaxID=3032595 RepID=UPI0023DC8534|nr:sugar transferase [Aliiglaciecola sp. CAU 1673]MDF2177505.1 sugar transferase [Aliiglaciecola sp. CAU 1673]